MRRGLYRAMALVNIRSGRRFYLPFLFTILMTVSMFYSMCSISRNPAFAKNSTVPGILRFGVVVLGLFSFVFLFYTNSFLMKRRKRELGLYSILGLEKRHITRILAWETGLLAFAGIAGGLALGLLLDRLMFLVILWMFQYPVSTSYQVFPEAISATFAAFAGLFALIFLWNVYSIRRSSAIELLNSKSAGEREPRGKGLLTLLGVLFLGVGYYLALSVTNLVTALNTLFLAVILVMLGTYCLFVAGCTAVLKILRKWRNYYYRTNHFVAVSGLIYRMKQNAVGLANICILSTGVLLILSTTVCLYAGIQEILEERFPKEISVQYDSSTVQENAALEQLIRQTAAQRQAELQDLQGYRSITVVVERQMDAFVSLDEQATKWENLAALNFVTAQDYQKLSGETVDLQKGEVAVYTAKGEPLSGFSFAGESFHVRRELAGFPIENKFAYMAAGWHNIVVADDAALEHIDELQKSIYQGTAASGLEYILSFNVKGGEEAALAFDRALKDALQEHADTVKLPSVNCRYQFREDVHGLYGSMLFLGIYLGVIFLSATVLIIYYKQISEGYEDRERYVIMQNVGMDRREIRQSINSQVRLMFFLPLMTALVHCTAAFHIMRLVMTGFYMNNVRLFAEVTLIVAGVFTVGYLLVFLVTSRTYYRIVS